METMISIVEGVEIRTEMVKTASLCPETGYTSPEEWHTTWEGKTHPELRQSTREWARVTHFAIEQRLLRETSWMREITPF